MQSTTKASKPWRSGDERDADDAGHLGAAALASRAPPDAALVRDTPPEVPEPLDRRAPDDPRGSASAAPETRSSAAAGDLVSPRNRSIKHLLKHAAQSARMWSVALASSLSKRRSVAIAPSGTRWDPASNLRAWKLAPALRRLGWRVLLLAPEATLAERQRVLRLWRPDVLLLQQSRHPLNRPHFYPGVSCVFDQDDADYLDARVRNEIIGCCEGSSLVIAGSHAVGRMLERHNRNVEVIWTSTPAPAARVRAQARRPAITGLTGRRAAREPPSLREPIVAWAHGSPFEYPAELAYVQRVMALVARVRPGTQFWLFGCPDDGPDAADVAAAFRPLEAAGIRCRAWPYMSYARYLDVVARAAVGLQPVCVQDSPYSEGKSFGKVLAYLAGEVPVVASNNVDHPLFFESGRNGFLVHDEFDCAQAVVTLLDDKALRDDLAMTALQDFRMRLSTAAVAAQVSAALLRAIGAVDGDTIGADEALDEPVLDGGAVDDADPADASRQRGVRVANDSTAREAGAARPFEPAADRPQDFVSPMRASSATR